MRIIEGPPTLTEVVVAALEANGFRVYPDGHFESLRARTRFYGSVSDAVRYARRFGLATLGGKLGFEARLLVSSSERNRFMERRAGAAFEREIRERLKRMDLGPDAVRVVEEET